MRRFIISVICFSFCIPFLFSCSNINNLNEPSLNEQNSFLSVSSASSDLSSVILSENSNDEDDESDISVEYSIPWSLDASEEEVKDREEDSQYSMRYFNLYPFQYSEALDLSDFLDGKIIAAEYWSIFYPSVNYCPEFTYFGVCGDGTSVFLSIKWDGAVYRGDDNNPPPDRVRVAVLNQTLTKQLIDIISDKFFEHYSFYEFYEPDYTMLSSLIPMDGSQYYISGEEGEDNKILYRWIPEFYYPQDESVPEYEEFIYPIGICRAFSDFGAREDIDWIVLKKD